MIGKNPKWYVGVSIAIALGALASGLWEVALRPTTFWVVKVMLKASTLGLESATNDFYKGVALGQGAEFGMVFLFVACWSFIALYWLAEKFHFESIEEAALKELRSRTEETDDPEMASDLERKIKKAVEKRRKDKVFCRYSTLFMAFFVTMFSFFWGLHAIGREMMRNQFEQYIAICRPYMNERQESQFHSHFSQMQTQEDYEKLMNELVEIALKNKVTCPLILLF